MAHAGGARVIDGVTLKPLRRFRDARGSVLKMQEATDPEFKGFGEVYFSTVHPGAVKAWRRSPAWRNYRVVHGTIRLVLVDLRDGSPTRGAFDEIEMGDDHDVLVQIPPGVWSGFMGLGGDEAIVCDLTDRPNAAAVVEKREPDDAAIGYDWGARLGSD